MTSDSAAIVVASISGAVAIAVAIRGERERSRLAHTQAEQALQLQEARIRADAANARIAEEAALRAQEARLRMEMRTVFMAEEAIRGLLKHSDWTLRSFDEIQKRVRGFEPQELRQLLVRAGAVAFTGQRGEELWGLRERNDRDL
jgi:hypothetical protein